MSISFAEIAATRRPPQSIDFDNDSLSSIGDGLPTAALVTITVAELTTLAGCGAAPMGTQETVEQQSVTPQPQPETTGGSQTHVVQAGENLFRIAIRYNTSIEAIMTANPAIKRADEIYAGQTLTIPGGGGAPAGQEPGKVAQNPPSEQQKQSATPPPSSGSEQPLAPAAPASQPETKVEVQEQQTSTRILNSEGAFRSWASLLPGFFANPSGGIEAKLPLEPGTDTSQVSFSVETVFGRDVLAVRGLPAGARLLGDIRNVALHVSGIKPGYAGSFLPEYGSFQAFLIYNPETGIYYAITAESLNKADLSIGGGYVNPGGALKSPAQVVIFGFKNPPNDSSEIISEYYSVR